MAASGTTALIVLCGGHGTRFRPLSLEVPKPLFPIAGKPMVDHMLLACKGDSCVSAVYLLGFYPEAAFADYVAQAEAELGIPVKYLEEPQGEHGTAGGVTYFAEELTSGNHDTYVIANGDVCSDFAFNALVDAHTGYGGDVTVLCRRVARDQASNFGCLVHDPETGVVKHYAEKPESFVSDVVNCGIYAFSASAMAHISEMVGQFRTPGTPHYASKQDPFAAVLSQVPTQEVSISLERDILIPLVSKGTVYALQTRDVWTPIKSAHSALRANEVYLEHARDHSPSLLVSQSDVEFTVIGNVHVHPSATVDVTATIGPNVAIGPNAVVGAGCRVANAILLDNVTLAPHSFVKSAIIGWESTIGAWSRVEGDAGAAGEVKHTVVGKGVTVGSELVVRNCIVLPNKKLRESCFGRIIL